MRNYLFLKPSKKISFYSPKLIVSCPDPPPFFSLDSKEQAKITEDIEEVFGSFQYISAYHKNADYFLKVNSAMGYCYTTIGQSF